MTGTKKINALVVSHDERLREIVELYLISEGFDVLAVKNYEAALGHIDRHSPDMIISEQGRSSAEAKKFFRDIQKFRSALDAYKIILCDSCNPENGCEGLEQYADLYFQMPLTKESVDHFLSRVITLWKKTAKA